MTTRGQDGSCARKGTSQGASEGGQHSISHCAWWSYSCLLCQLLDKLSILIHVSVSQ